MKKYALLIVGIAGLIASFIWMSFSKSSTGLFLLLAGMSGVTIEKGICNMKSK